MQNRVLSMLGITAKSGNIVSGEFAAEKAVKTGMAYLVITAEDASANTRKKFRDMTTFYQVHYEEYASKEDLGRAIGKEYRAVVAVTDENLAKAVLQKMSQEPLLMGKVNNGGK